MEPEAPFVRHSKTSLEAALAIEPHLEPLEEEVLACFQGAGEHGLTDAELAYDHSCIFGKRLESTLRARRISLTAKGKLEDSGTVRKGASGRNMTVWRVRG